MRKPRPVDTDRAVQATLGRIYTARTLASVAFGDWEAMPVPRSIALAYNLAYAEIMLEEKPPADARELMRWKMRAASIRQEMETEQRKAASPGPARDARAAWDDAKQRWEDAYAEYARLVDAGRAMGVREDDAT